jgi:hypothetical protein
MRLPPTLCICALAAAASACASPQFLEKPPEAELIAFYGHGKLFDRDMNEIKPDPVVLGRMQEAMIAQIQRTSPNLTGKNAPPARLEAERLLQSTELTPGEALVVRSAVIRDYLRGAPEEVQVRYAWRSGAAVSAYLNDQRLRLVELSPAIRDLLERLRYYDPNQGEDTSYMEYCRSRDVPVPPDWAETGTAWVRQGTLTQNLLAPGAFAAVWTYTDPARRGACIALPRGDGGPGSPSGIICQSATTGAACFWDNIRRGTEPEQFIGWRGQRLVISQLKDGSNLNAPCTDCHRGDNVYNIAPDDPTWAKLLRGPMSGPRPGTFTTRVESSTDNTGGRPRYVPLTTMPARPGWQNTYTTPSCGGCHERPAPINVPPMPPACATGGNAANCYGTP